MVTRPQGNMHQGPAASGPNRYPELLCEPGKLQNVGQYRHERRAEVSCLILFTMEDLVFFVCI